MKKFQIQIDEKEVLVSPGTTLVQAIRDSGGSILTWCHSKGQKSPSVCRLCSVGVKGMDRLVPACSTLVQPGMEIKVETNLVQKSRQMNLRLMLKEHDTCDRRICQLCKVAQEEGVPLNISHNAPGERIRSFEYLSYDPSPCARCDRCVTSCSVTGVIERKPSELHYPFFALQDPLHTSCTGCGDCAASCKTGALVASEV
jgi:NADP-reducing hydrogenase subunit HndD